jgi:hypothetical protein
MEMPEFGHARDFADRINPSSHESARILKGLSPLRRTLRRFVGEGPTFAHMRDEDPDGPRDPRPNATKPRLSGGQVAIPADPR